MGERDPSRCRGSGETTRLNQALTDLVEAGDINRLLRAVDGLCERRSWDELLDLGDACEHAIDRGKQLWPIAAHIDYRLALEAPGEYAAGVLDPEVGRFAVGPLTEVASSTHEWRELAPYLEMPQVAAYVAQERVQRGEVLDGDVRAHPGVLELPLHLEPWEPTYALATFLPHEVDVAEPWEPRAAAETVELRPGAAELDEPELVAALLDLVQPWTTESNGAARAIVVEGVALDACSTLAGPTLRLGALTGEEALQRMAWAAASGGAHGRRRGAALGRFTAWYTTSLLADLPWPAPADEMGRSVGRLRWFHWDEGEAEHGWVLRLAVQDDEDGWAVAVAATDLVD